MAIQISYPTATNVSLSDRLLGTQYDSETGSAATKNFSVSSVVALTLPYKVYTATFSQYNENAPVPTVLQNNIGAITWAYAGPGVFSIVSNSLFTLGKTTVSCHNLFGNWQVQPFPNYEESTIPDVIQILNVDTATNTTGNGIDKAYIEIRVYN